MLVSGCLQALKPDVTDITSWINVISIEHTADDSFVAIWLDFPFREGRIILFLKFQPRVYS